MYTDTYISRCQVIISLLLLGVGGVVVFYGISAHAPQSCSTHSLPCLLCPRKRSILCCLYIYWGMTKSLVASPMRLSSHLHRSRQLKRALWRPEQSEVSSPEPILLHAPQCWGLGASSPVRGRDQLSCALATAGITAPPSLPFAWVRGRDVLASFLWVLGI